ncbi:MAG TPA: hypothetical protein VM639_24280 [Dongiaceae bacterium]|nr:hypothetical protein [Dongiaceae bacterium]
MAKRRPERQPDVWDGWAPTDEMILRAAASRPFWTFWEREKVESIQELYDAFTMRCSALLVRSFDPARVQRRAAPFMSQAEEDIYGRLVQWLRDVHDAGLKRYVPMVQGVVVNEDQCPDEHLFGRIVSFHVKIRQAELQRYGIQRNKTR